MVEAVSCAGLENQNAPSENFVSLEEQLPEPHKNARLRIKSGNKLATDLCLRFVARIIGNNESSVSDSYTSAGIPQAPLGAYDSTI